MKKFRVQLLNGMIVEGKSLRDILKKYDGYIFIPPKKKRPDWKKIYEKIKILGLFLLMLFMPAVHSATVSFSQNVLNSSVLIYEKNFMYEQFTERAIIKDDNFRVYYAYLVRTSAPRAAFENRSIFLYPALHRGTSSPLFQSFVYKVKKINTNPPNQTIVQFTTPHFNRDAKVRDGFETGINYFLVVVQTPFYDCEKIENLEGKRCI